MFENVIPEFVDLALYDDDNKDEAIVLTSVCEDTCEIEDIIVTLEFICCVPLHRVLSAEQHKPFSREPLEYRMYESVEKIYQDDDYCVLLFKHYEKNELTCVKSTVCKFEPLYI